MAISNHSSGYGTSALSMNLFGVRSVCRNRDNRNRDAHEKLATRRHISIYSATHQSWLRHRTALRLFQRHCAAALTMSSQSYKEKHVRTISRRTFVKQAG